MQSKLAKARRHLSFAAAAPTCVQDRTAPVPNAFASRLHAALGRLRGRGGGESRDAVVLVLVGLLGGGLLLQQVAHVAAGLVQHRVGRVELDERGVDRVAVGVDSDVPLRVVLGVEEAAEDLARVDVRPGGAVGVVGVLEHAAALEGLLDLLAVLLLQAVGLLHPDARVVLLGAARGVVGEDRVAVRAHLAALGVEAAAHAGHVAVGRLDRVGGVAGVALVVAVDGAAVAVLVGLDRVVEEDTRAAAQLAAVLEVGVRVVAEVDGVAGLGALAHGVDGGQGHAVAAGVAEALALEAVGGAGHRAELVVDVVAAGLRDLGALALGLGELGARADLAGAGVVAGGDGGAGVGADGGDEVARLGVVL